MAQCWLWAPHGMDLACRDVILDLLWLSVASMFPLGYPCPHCLSPHFEKGGCWQPLATSLHMVIPGILQGVPTLLPVRQCPACPLCHPLGTDTFPGCPQPARAPFLGQALHSPLNPSVHPQVPCLTHLETCGWSLCSPREPPWAGPPTCLPRLLQLYSGADPSVL